MGLDRLEVIYSSKKTGCFIKIKQPVPEYIEKLSAPDKLHFCGVLGGYYHYNALITWSNAISVLFQKLASFTKKVALSID